MSAALHMHIVQYVYGVYNQCVILWKRQANQIALVHKLIETFFSGHLRFFDLRTDLWLLWLFLRCSIGAACIWYEQITDISTMKNHEKSCLHHKILLHSHRHTVECIHIKCSPLPVAIVWLSYRCAHICPHPRCTFSTFLGRCSHLFQMSKTYECNLLLILHSIALLLCDGVLSTHGSIYMELL